MHDERETYAEDEENEGRAEAEAAEVFDEFEDLGVALDVGDGVLEEHQAEEEEAEAHEEFAGVAEFGFAREEQREGEAHDGQGDGGDAEFKAEEGNEPEGGGGADVGAHDHADGLDEGEQAGVDETHHHHGGGRGGLDEARDQETAADAGETVARHGAHDAAELFPREFLQGLGHGFHAEEEHAEAAEEGEGCYDLVTRRLRGLPDGAGDSQGAFAGKCGGRSGCRFALRADEVNGRLGRHFAGKVVSVVLW